MTARIVLLQGGSPWGFRIYGGVDIQQPLKIYRVNPGSKAAIKGIREGDIVTSINGESTGDATNTMAHAMLKNAGDTLKLGLNEDCNTSPKKRQYKTVQLESHIETVKRSNSTSSSYEINTTKSQTQIKTNVNKNGTEKTNGNGNINLNADSKTNQGQDCISEKSTISSNYSSPASTPSTLTEDQGCEKNQSSIEHEGFNITSNMEKTSRSKRRRNARKKASNKCVVSNSAKDEGTTNKLEDINEKTTEENDIITIVKERDQYRVESPTPQAKTSRKSSPMIKSRSLDDDEALRIQELSETSENEDKNENTAVISEADSDVDWEVTTDLKITPLDKQNPKIMDTQSLQLEEIEIKERISNEDESHLRSFLQGLNLSTSPDESTRESSESIRTKRMQKREELSQYFLPVYHNPRFLDAISEENSDLSDKEQKDSKKSKNKKFFKPNPSQIKKAVILDRNDLETPIISDTCTTSIAESSSGVEVVFLEEDDSDDYADIEDDADEQRILLNQLTPPPSPDSEEFQEEPMQKASCHTSALSPTISALSSDREDSSSRGTSLCTTIFKEDIPASLRELCIQALVSLPFGEDVLEELADVSKSLEELTNNTQECNLKDSKDSFDLPVNREDMKTIKEEDEEWVGMPSEKNLGVLLCLSPNQRRYLDTTTPSHGEADTLLDLHNKFIERRNGKSEKDSSLISTINKENNTSDDLHFRSLATLPRNAQKQRLQAKDLTEWLELAKDKSKSETHLNLWEPIPKPRRNNTEKRRQSLPHEFYVQQMQYLIQKEKEIQQELERLEEEKRRLNNEMTPQFDPSQYHISKNEDIAIHTDELTKTKFTTPQSENFRKQMYEEYMKQVAERQDRKQHKVIKISSHQDLQPEAKDDAPHIKGIEDEFMTKVRKSKYGWKSDDSFEGSAEKSDADDAEAVLIDGMDIGQAKKLPKHLKEFVDITRQAAESILDTNDDHEDGIWTPGQRASFSSEETQRQSFQDLDTADDPVPPIWTPKSAGSSPQLERKEYRSLNFSSPVLGRKNKNSDGPSQIEPPWRSTENASDIRSNLTSALQKRLPNSHSAPASGFTDLSQAPRLPRAQNPTITLLQKAREGQLPKGASYIEEAPPIPRKHESPPRRNPGEIVYEIKREYTSEPEGENPRRVVELRPRKFSGVGPTTKDGMPLTLRSEVKDQNQSKWYKRMYDTIHKQKPRYDDDYVTLRYKQRRGRYPYNSGYLSEPEPGAYDSDVSMYDTRSTTLDTRRVHPNSSDTVTTTYTIPRNTSNGHSGLIKHGKDAYKNQPGRIENYIPGHSSISEKEAKAWWDEVMDIFDGHLEQQKHIPSKGHMSQALKDVGYESDSTLVFRRREEAASQLSPLEQREAYKTIQKGGDVPLHGLRKLAPERPKEPEVPIPPPKGYPRKPLDPESPRKYVENEVTIHYKTPVRQEVKESLSEEELQRRQAEHMKKVYQEERRRKYLQELQDMTSRRHTDNFIPSQKSPIPLNRYDDFIDDLSPKLKPRPRSPEPRLVAKALYNFVGQSARELTFRKGDIIYIRRQIDKNWYEGEFNAMVGLFPSNYVEIVPYDGMKSTIRKPHEGQARAKYNFIAQTHLELSLAKGELVVITRKVDDNWYEGKIGGRKGIFPVSYVDILIDPSDPPPVIEQSKPVASPAAHSLLANGSLGGKESMGAHNYVPPVQRTESSHSYHAKPVQMTGSGTYASLNRRNPLNQELHVDTQSEYVPYRALYKYKPQNEDEIELLEGDTVFVLEKCDDGWFVGSSERTGALGTFPGNYVERIQ